MEIKHIQGLEDRTYEVYLKKPKTSSTLLVTIYYIKDTDGKKEWTTDYSSEEEVLKTGYVFITKKEMEDLN